MGLGKKGASYANVRRGPPELPDPYFIRFLKLVPVEAIAPFPFLMDYGSKLSPTDGSPRYALYTTAWLLLACVVLMRWKAAWEPGVGRRWSSVWIPAIAFFIWAHVMGSDFGFELLLNQLGGGAGTDEISPSFEAGGIVQGLKFSALNLLLVLWSFGAPAVFVNATRSPSYESTSYLDKLVLLSPSEAIVVFPLMMDFANRMALFDGSQRWAVYLVAWVLLILLIVVRWGQRVPWGAIGIAAVAFFIWVHVMGGDFGFELLLNSLASGSGADGISRTSGAVTTSSFNELQSFVSNVMLMAWGTLAPVVYRGFVRRKPTVPRTNDTVRRAGYTFDRVRWQGWMQHTWTATKVSGTALAVFAPIVYALAQMALVDLEQAPPSTVGGTSLANLAVAADAAGAVGIWRGNTQIAALTGHGTAPVTADILPGATSVLTTNYEGLVHIDRIELATSLYGFTQPRLSSAIYDRLWRPYGAPVARQALWLAAQIVPLHIPDTRRGRRGRVFKDCPECPEMIEIEPGVVLMGSPLSELQRHSDEGPRQLIAIPQPFAVGRFEVTFAEWDACVAAGGCGGHRPSDEGWGRDRRPVINVSWVDAKTYVAWISQRTGKPYRLLTETEWEFVERAGTTSQYQWGHAVGKGNANCDGCGSQWDNKQTAPVGSFEANANGVFDLNGNVMEWVEDCQVVDSNCDSRVVRGGSWGSSPLYLRAAYRDRIGPNIRNRRLGFRLARTIEP